MWVSLCVGVLGGGCHTVGVGLPPGQHLPTPKHHFGDMQDLARWSCNWWFSSLHLEFRLICTFCAFLVCAATQHHCLLHCCWLQSWWSVILCSVSAAVWGVVQCFNVRGMQCAVQQCSVFQCFNVRARYAAECQLVWCGSAAGQRVVILANFTF